MLAVIIPENRINRELQESAFNRTRKLHSMTHHGEIQ
jgi:hypothetical protein